jgi:hypothetical protein
VAHKLILCPRKRDILSLWLALPRKELRNGSYRNHPIGSTSLGHDELYAKPMLEAAIKKQTCPHASISSLYTAAFIVSMSRIISSLARYIEISGQGKGS